MSIASYVHTGSLYTSAPPLEFLWTVYARTQENGKISLYQGVLSLESMVYTA